MNHILVFSLLLISSFASYPVFSVGEWEQWLETGRKVCKVSDSSGNNSQWWYDFETSPEWGGSTRSMWSDDGESYLPKDSKYLLCPRDSSSCGIISYYIYPGDKVDIQTNFVPAPGAWFSKLNIFGHGGELTFYNYNTKRVRASVYRKINFRKYEHIVQFDFKSNEEVSIDVKNEDVLYLIIVPVDQTRTGGFEVFVKQANEKFPVGATIGIAFGGLAACFFLSWMTWWICKKCKSKKNNKYQNLQNERIQPLVYPEQHDHSNVFYGQAVPVNNSIQEPQEDVYDYAGQNQHMINLKNA